MKQPLGFDWCKQNSIPVAWQLLFITATLILPKTYNVYTNFIFYSGLLFYVLRYSKFSLIAWKITLFNKRNTIYILCTALSMILMVGATLILERFTPDWATGMIMLPCKNLFGLVLFGATTMVIAPITEELFYRQSLIDLRSRKATIVTATLSILLFALNHALLPWGIFIVSIWALPFTLAYIKTRNVYIPMSAHLILNILVNGITVISAVIAL